MRAIAFLAAAVFSAGASAQSEMRFSHFVAPTHPSFAGLQAWADSLAHATGGKLKVRMFPSEQLGKAKDQYDMVRDGIADGAWVVPGYTPGRFPVATLLELPFMVGNASEGSFAFDRWYRAHAAREMRGVHYCLGFVQEPGVLHTVKRVNKPGDLKGLKLRSPTVPMNDFFNHLGANSVAIPAPQVREAMERGTIDGAAFAWQTATSLGVTKAASFHLDAPVYTVPVAYLLNPSFYERQPPELKKAIDAHCSPDWARKIGSDWAEREKAGAPAVRTQAGHTVMTVSPAELTTWKQAAAPLLDQWKMQTRNAGLDPDLVLNDLQEALRKAGAAY